MSDGELGRPIAAWVCKTRVFGIPTGQCRYDSIEHELQRPQNRFDSNAQSIFSDRETSNVRLALHATECSAASDILGSFTGTGNSPLRARPGAGWPSI